MTHSNSPDIMMLPTFFLPLLSNKGHAVMVYIPIFTSTDLNQKMPEGCVADNIKGADGVAR